jgi:hypothetical protein
MGTAAAAAAIDARAGRFLFPAAQLVDKAPEGLGAPRAIADDGAQPYFTAR